MKRLQGVSAVFLLAAAAAAQEGSRPGSWVVIPVDAYGALRAKAYPADREAEPPAVEATLSRVDYNLRLDGALASGRATIDIDVLKDAVLRDAWVRVPIPPGLLIREATLDGKPVALVPGHGKSDPLLAVLSKSGRAVLQLEVAFTVGSSGGVERLILPPSASGVTRAELTLGQQEIEVTVSGGLLAGSGDGRWVAFARGSEPLEFTWRKKMEQRRSELPLRARGSLTQLFSLGDDGAALHVEVEIEIVQGAARHATVSVPEGVTINQVPGATVADWDTRPGLLIVNFLEPAERSVKFAVDGEIRAPRDGGFAVPLLRLVGMERESGGVAVEVLGAGEIRESRTEGLDRADASELGPSVAARQSPSLAAFRYRPGDGARRLDVAIARYAQQAMLTALVEDARYRSLISPDGKILVEARYAIRNNQRNFVRVALPSGAVLWSASLAGRPVRPGKDADGSLLLPLSKGRAGEEAPLFPVEILFMVSGSAWTGKGRGRLELPALDLPVSRTRLVLHYPPLFRVAPEPGAFRSETEPGPDFEVLSEQENSSVAPRDNSSTAQNATQELVDRYRARSDARKGTAAGPLRVAFPAVGPTLDLISDLTPEGRPPTLDLSYQQQKQGGDR